MFYLFLNHLFIHLCIYYCISFIPKVTKVISSLDNLIRLRGCSQLLSVSHCWDLFQDRVMMGAYQRIHRLCEPSLPNTECFFPSTFNFTCWNHNVLVIGVGLFGGQLSQEGGAFMNGISTLVHSLLYESVRWWPRNKDLVPLKEKICWWLDFIGLSFQTCKQ